MQFIALGVLGLGASLIAAAPSQKQDKRYVEKRGDVEYNVFEHAATGGKMSFVTNSGICETTPGVNQYSGYFSVGTNMNMCMFKCKPRRHFNPD